MAIPLKQSTASQEVPLGYFVDSTDGNTEETGLTISNTDIKIWKSGATTLADKNSGGATHISNGIYYAVLDATDTDTLGPLVIFVHESGALPVRVECVVLSANNYDSAIAASDFLQVDAVQISGDTTAADNLEADFDETDGAVLRRGILDQGTAQSATATTIVLRAGASFGNDTIIGATVIANGSTQGYAQAKVITDYDSATDTATVSTWAVTPSGTITYKIHGSAAGASTVDANVVSISGDSTAADNAEAFFDGTGYAGTGNTIPTVTTVNGLANNVITAASINADALTAAKVAADVGTEIAAAVLAAATANPIDANVQEINDVTVNGNGAGTPWGP
jgi:hypothetical protein